MRKERIPKKKICVLLALICLLTLGMTAACAENVQLSFVGESGNANVGYACEVAEDIMAMFGKETTLMRPPFGDVDKNVIAMARAEGQEVIMWTIDSHDWGWDDKHEDVVKRVTKDVGPGTIILFHLDGFWTPEVLAEVLPYYQEELGLKVVTVTELLSMEGKGPDARLEGAVQEEVPAEEAPAQETAE